MDPYAKAIAQMEACRAHAQQQAPLHRQEVQQEAEQVSDLFAATIEPELKKVQFALQSAHYRSRVRCAIARPKPA